MQPSIRSVGTGLLIGGLTVMLGLSMKPPDPTVKSPATPAADFPVGTRTPRSHAPRHRHRPAPAASTHNAPAPPADGFAAS